MSHVLLLSCWSLALVTPDAMVPFVVWNECMYQLIVTYVSKRQHVQSHDKK